MKWFAATLLLLGLTGCASTPLEIAGLEFVNATDEPITDAELRVLGTYELASCNFIVAQGQFSTKFPLLEYRGNEIQVFWKTRNGNYVYGPELIPPPKETPEKPVIVVITFSVGGRAAASFREESGLVK
ncbi:hypothetical protein P4C99_01310 [Pontiellaceae bacterium B1224]|nr:hypothetical protein [Pontiellaceae bacterium B1224]